jgi:transposase
VIPDQSKPVRLFVDFEYKRTIFVTESKDHRVLEAFATDLAEHNWNPYQITQVSYDMSPAFIKGVENTLPDAAIVFDRFHVTKVINEAVDKVRKAELGQNPILRNARYLFLKNRENLTIQQSERLEDIRLRGLNLKTMKALNIRESFQQIYLAPTPELFDKLLRKWYLWANHSLIEPIKEYAYTIQRH